MERCTALLLFFVPLLAGCAAAPDRQERAYPIPAAVSLGERARPDVGATNNAERATFDDVAFAVWRDPDFQRRFAESYLAETEIEPSVTAVEREELQEVLELISEERMDEAAELLRERGGGAASPVYDFMLGNVHFQAEELEPAAAAYEAAVEKYPKYLRAWRNLGIIRVRQGEFEGAREAFTRVLELGRGDAFSYGLLGFAHANLGDHLAAESAYRMAILLGAETADWKMGLARSFFEQERYSEAVALTDLLIEAEPNRPELWLLQANAYIGLGQPLKAAENFEVVDSLGQSTAASLNTLADVYTNEQLFDVAVDSYLRALEMDPDVSPSRALRAAQALTTHGALDETRRLLEGVDRLRGEQLDDATRKDLLKQRARVAVAEGGGEEEASLLEQIVELDPLDGDALILLGDHSARGGDVEQAIFYYERAASLEDFEPDAKLQHARLLVRQGRYAEALPLLRRVQSLEPRESVRDYLEEVVRVAQSR